MITEAVDDKVAADTVSRNALIKVQNTLSKLVNTSQRRSESRAMSIAPSVVEDIVDESRVVSEADVTETEEGTVIAPTPVASPRKKTVKAAAPRRKKSTIEDSELEAEEDTTELPAQPSISMTLPDRSRPVRQVSADHNDENENEDDDATPQPIKRRGRPAKAKPEARAEVEESILDTTEVEAVPVPAATKKLRGKPTKATVPASSPDVEVEESVLENENTEEPVKKARGRPVKEGTGVGGGRRSVRAGRKKVEE